MSDVKVTLDVERAVSILAEACGPALYQRKQDILQESAKFVPFLTGALLASGATVGPVVEHDYVEVKNSYDTPYALLQHETREFKHGNAGEWKYLDRAEAEGIPGLLRGLRQDLGLDGGS